MAFVRVVVLGMGAPPANGVDAGTDLDPVAGADLEASHHPSGYAGVARALRVAGSEDGATRIVNGPGLHDDGGIMQVGFQGAVDASGRVAPG